MSKAKRERSPLYPKILFGFPEHPITVWAGVILLRLYFEWIGLRKELGECLAGFVKRSNNQIGAVDVMLSWFYGLALGAERFEHFTRYRRDRLLGELLGVQRFGSPDTLRRLFLRFNYRQVTEVSERLMRFSLSGMRPILMGHTLDLDSTVLCRYGKQEGSLKGYNPQKPGRPSRHPLVAFLAEGRRLLWAVLRSGNSGSANGCVEFLKQALGVVPSGHRIGLVRADAGFFEKRLLEYLESQELPYIIVARLTAVVRKLVIHQIPSTAWRVVARGVEVGDLEVSLPNWRSMKRRFVCLRQEIFERPEARGRRLIDCPGYTIG
jgi:Transposase DDE domain group 1